MSLTKTSSIEIFGKFFLEIDQQLETNNWLIKKLKYNYY